VSKKLSKAAIADKKEIVDINYFLSNDPSPVCIIDLIIYHFFK